MAACDDPAMAADAGFAVIQRTSTDFYMVFELYELEQTPCGYGLDLLKPGW